jgi:alpha-beta hydrolase superfamily lysophospholipase
VLGRLAPGVAVSSGLDSGDLSHDPEVARAYDGDPLVHDRICARLAQPSNIATELIIDTGWQCRCRPATVLSRAGAAGNSAHRSP